jgi:hypothetical protein
MGIGINEKSKLNENFQDPLFIYLGSA